MADKVYQSNGYTYTVDDNGTITAKGTVSEDPASRKGMEKITPDGYDSKVDDKGHVIAAREGGVPAEYNVTAQDRGLNRGAYKTVENAEVRLANDGYKVDTEKIAYVSNPGEKPSAYMVNDTITTPDGQTHTVNLSFSNMSAAEQEQIENDLANVSFNEEPNSSPLPEGMTADEYNQYLSEIPEDIGSVRDEFDMENTYSVHFDTENNSTTEGILDNDVNDFGGAAPSLDTTEGSGVLDNDANEFGGAAPSLDTTEGSGVLDNDANEFDGAAPSLEGGTDDGITGGTVAGTEDAGEAEGSGEGTDSGGEDSGDEGLD